MAENDAIQKLIESYDLGDMGGDPHEGSVPVRVAPQQKRPAGIPATQAVPPRDPQGRFLPATPQPSAPNAHRQVASEDPLQYSQEPGEPPQVYEHTRTLYRHAIQTGFTDAEIDSTPSEELQDRVFNRQREMFSKAQASPAPNVSAVEKPPVVEPDPEVSLGEFEKALEPEVVTPLKAHLVNQLKQLKALEAKLEAAEKREQERVQVDQQRSRDQAIDKMLSKHAHFLGAESIAELYEGNPNLAKRRAVLGLANADTSNRSNQEKIDYAVSQLFGPAPHQEEESQQPQRNGRPTAAQWANGGVPRPTQRKPAPEVDGVRRAIKEVSSRLEQMNRPGENGTVDLDDFPG